MVKRYRLKGLACAHCAMKIGQAVKALPGVSEARVHFAAQRLTVEFAGEPGMEAEAQIRDAVQAIEPDTKVLPWQDQTAAESRAEADERRKAFAGAFWAMGLSLLLLAAGVLLTHVWQPAALALTVAAYLLAGFPVIRAAALRLKSGQSLDETLLMTVATLGAWALHEGMEAAAVMLFYRLGETLQEMAVFRSRRDIRALSVLVGDTAHVVLTDVVDMPVAAVHPGDTLEVRTGERVPVDGEIVSGHSALDVSALTGEAVPAPCAPGDKVLSGSMNTGPMIHILCEKPASESAVARILRMTREETAKKAAPERFLAKFAAVYTPAVVIFAAFIFLFPPIFGLGSFAEWGYRALLLLMISCPCALVLSVPLSYAAGMGDSARRGLLVKGGAVLEALAKVDTLAMDKTGTLTEGVFRLRAVRPAAGVSKDLLMEAALTAESRAQHPMARGVFASPEAEEWLSSKALPRDIETHEEIPGKGVRVRAGGREILCGSAALLAENGIATPREHVEDQVHTALDGQYLGSFLLADGLRPEAAGVLKTLQKLGIRYISVLTGDAPKGTEAVKSLPGLDGVLAGLLPEGKVAAVRRMAAGHRRVAFVGDGINDAPVLAAADVGIAMGGIGSQAAMEAADCVLAAGTLNALPEGILTARRTARIVRINVALALLIKLSVMMLGVAGLATMGMAVVADVGVSLMCVLLAGSVRLRKPCHM